MHFSILQEPPTTMSSSEPQSKAKVLRTTKETHPNLPPGLVLDPDGKVCKVCNSWQDYGKMNFKKKVPSGSSSSAKGKGMMAGFGGMAGLSTTSSDPSSSSTSPTSTSPPPSAAAQNSSRENCPADTAALGRSTWTFLHTSAAYYPLSPTPEHKKQMTNLLNSLGLLYPCAPCAEDFQEKIKENPPDVSSRYGLSRWLCERHNEVNEKLGKGGFGCDWENLDRRWKGGPEDGSCD
jgi:FAD-linked sulfhydryl oxidase